MTFGTTLDIDPIMPQTAVGEAHEKLATQDALERHRRLWYLATPYTGSTQDIMDLRWWAGTRIAAWLVRQGIHVYAPVTMTGPIAHEGDIQGGFQAWAGMDKTFIDKCDALAVGMLPGWNRSEGVKEEIATFEEQEKPIVYIDPAFLFTVDEWAELAEDIY
jgi:hypothetical protein